MKRLIVCAIAASALLVGCSNPAPPPPKKPPAPRAAGSTAMTGTPIDSLLRAENKAKGVQKTVDAQAAAQRKAIEAQSQ
jgi:hypothetical protein